jgi:hypothetical protein
MATELTTPEQPKSSGQRVEIVQSNEPWTVVQLADGTQLRMKTVIADVFYVPGVYDKDGNPTYNIRASAVFVVDAPARLRKPNS